MMYPRYGAFRLSDYHTSWLGMGILSIFAVLSALLKLPLFLVAFPLAYMLFWGWTIFDQNSEKFVLTDDVIVTNKYGKQQRIHLPSELTLLVSYADICPPLSRHVSIGNKTHILKGRYAISILREMPLNAVLSALHQIPVQKYTTSTIQTVFDGYRYIYCFVCDIASIERVMKNRQCLVIVPESLQEEVSIQSTSATTYIDWGY